MLTALALVLMFVQFSFEYGSRKFQFSKLILGIWLICLLNGAA